MDTRIQPAHAREILAAYNVAIPADFHALRTYQQTLLGEGAVIYGYRQPANANGSRARYFHAYLQRLAERK